MKIIAISDTHGQHASLALPEADMVIHAGDLTKRGTLNQVKDFLDWYSQLPHRYKIFIAGNHDFLFEDYTDQEIRALIPDNLIYLNDSEVIIEGIKIWGSPIQPWFHDWAFNRRRGAEIKRHWDLIPNDADIVVTHGPVYGVLDRTSLGQQVGCEDLLEKIRTVKPKYHICGHIHEAYGAYAVGGTQYINASVLDLGYKLVNEPVLMSIEADPLGNYKF